MTQPKNMLLLFLPHHNETWTKLVTHELVMVVKFRNDWVKIAEFFNSTFLGLCHFLLLSL